MTREQEQYITDNFGLMPVEALRNRFNKKYGTDYKVSAFHYHTKRLGLSKHIEHQYTAEEDKFLKENSPLMSREELTREFNSRFGTSIKINTINVRCLQRGWSASNDGRFKQGGVPWQKTKGGREEYVSKLKGGNSTSFKKGQVPHNTMPIGAERISSKGEYVIKTENGWKSKRQLVWEKHYGEIPKGMRVVSVIGDKNDANLNNLRLIDNDTQTLLMANRWHKSGSDIFDAGVTYAKLYLLLKEQMGLNYWDFRNRLERRDYG
ncbi:HNH endonuclease [Butyrivibrio sp. INlla21]|uniref:HNH endonuclease n=1 Tax=Butyrivibrio sp. INlla21 TaxID=1520811 RepID=UPI0008EE7806|nr:HNH endonuclease [Butyrivibrio sp. INlla21]SFU36937.1 HNH endonuclease [Butyrivibrio sp. INlla21]